MIVLEVLIRFAADLHANSSEDLPAICSFFDQSNIRVDGFRRGVVDRRHDKQDANMKFDLLFFPEGYFTSVPEAYVCALSLSGYDKPDKRAGHVLLTTESTSAAECHAQIDRLIADLQKLKQKASQKFKG